MNPYTNNEICGAISLGSHDNHKRLGDEALSKLFVDGKNTSNFNLMFAVVWKLVQDGQF